MEINRNSWHYKVATLVTPEHQINRDLCGYIRAVLVGLGLSFFMLVAGVLILLFAVLNILGIIEMFMGTWAKSPYALVNIAGLGIALMYGIPALFRWSRKRLKESSQASEPSLVARWYRDHKEKVCSTIKFKG
jgi:hypothetical protein